MLKKNVGFYYFSAHGGPLDRSWRPWGKLLAVQEANLGSQMNLIELLEGVLGTSRALPPPFGRVPGGPEGAKVVPWSDLGAVSGGPGRTPGII